MLFYYGSTDNNVQKYEKYKIIEPTSRHQFQNYSLENILALIQFIDHRGNVKSSEISSLQKYNSLLRKTECHSSTQMNSNYGAKLT